MAAAGPTAPVAVSISANQKRPIPHRAQPGAHSALPATLDLELLPPEISLQPPATEITRSGPAYDTAVSDLEPTQQIIPVQISWPDEKPRELTAVVWQVNGVRQPQMNTLKPDAAGQIMLSWNVKLLDEGRYEFVIDAIDELGYTAKSEPATIEIVTELP